MISRWDRNLVRCSARAGLGPRDITPPARRTTLVGGTMYWGASLEFDYPLYFLPRYLGFTGAVFMDSGSVWGYKAETSKSGNRRNQQHDSQRHAELY